MVPKAPEWASVRLRGPAATQGPMRGIQPPSRTSSTPAPTTTGLPGLASTLPTVLTDHLPPRHTAAQPKPSGDDFNAAVSRVGSVIVISTALRERRRHRCSTTGRQAFYANPRRRRGECGRWCRPPPHLCTQRLSPGQQDSVSASRNNLVRGPGAHERSADPGGCRRCAGRGQPETTTSLFGSLQAFWRHLGPLVTLLGW